MIRYLLIYVNYLLYKINMSGSVKFNGFTVIYAFSGSKILFAGGYHKFVSPVQFIGALSTHNNHCQIWRKDNDR